jgi:hypothetical protein
MVEDAEGNMDANCDVERSERNIVDLYQKHSRGPSGYQHFYLFGIRVAPSPSRSRFVR